MTILINFGMLKSDVVLKNLAENCGNLGRVFLREYIGKKMFHNKCNAYSSGSMFQRKSVQARSIKAFKQDLE